MPIGNFSFLFAHKCAADGKYSKSRYQHQIALWEYFGFVFFLGVFLALVAVKEILPNFQGEKKAAGILRN